MASTSFDGHPTDLSPMHTGMVNNPAWMAL
jgi:hypothetical protein